MHLIFSQNSNFWLHITHFGPRTQWHSLRLDTVVEKLAVPESENPVDLSQPSGLPPIPIAHEEAIESECGPPKRASLFSL